MRLLRTVSTDAVRSTAADWVKKLRFSNWSRAAGTVAKLTVHSGEPRVALYYSRSEPWATVVWQVTGTQCMWTIVTVCECNHLKTLTTVEQNLSDHEPA